MLTGTILGRNSREGTAFIGTDERNPQTYTAGAILANGAQLTEIATDYVVLEKDGKSVQLYAQNVKSRARVESDLLKVGGAREATRSAPNYSEMFTEFLRPSPVFDGNVLKGYEVYAGKNSSLFWQLGFRAGDVITAFENAPISDAGAAMEMFRQLASGMTMTATVARKGKAEQLLLDGALVTAEFERNKAAGPRQSSNLMPAR